MTRGHRWRGGFVAGGGPGPFPHPTRDVHLHPWGAAAWAPPVIPSPGCILDTRGCDTLSLGKLIPLCWSCQSQTPADPVFGGQAAPVPVWWLSVAELIPRSRFSPPSAENPTRFGNEEPPSNHLRFSQHPESRLFRNRQRLCLRVPARVPDPVLPGTASCRST